MAARRSSNSSNAGIPGLSFLICSVLRNRKPALLEALLQGKKNPVNEFLLGNVDAEGEPAHALALIDGMKKKRGRRV